MPDPNNPEALLPQVLITQHLAQLHAIADSLAPTDALQLIVDSDDALQYPELMQYACGTEHLELAIAYLSRAIGVNGTAADAPPNDDPELGYERGVRNVEIQWKHTAPEETLPPETPD